jgi:hypothetical protein
MKPQFVFGNVRANCPNCGGAVTSFEHIVSGTELGVVLRGGGPYVIGGRPFGYITYHLVRCAGCGSGGLTTVHHNGDYTSGMLGDFYPRTIDMLPIPQQVPPGVQSEFKEAELCASVGAWRAGSSLLRSTLEKTLVANGYEKGSLATRIDEAAADGAITAARSKRAHEDIRVLGNDVLHDEWREVTQDEFDLAHHYAQRILEDFYDDRPSVEALLISKGRLKAP